MEVCRSLRVVLNHCVPDALQSAMATIARLRRTLHHVRITYAAGKRYDARLVRMWRDEADRLEGEVARQQRQIARLEQSKDKYRRRLLVLKGRQMLKQRR